jgi:hypothetical protein
MYLISSIITYVNSVSAPSIRYGLDTTATELEEICSKCSSKDFLDGHWKDNGDAVYHLQGDDDDDDDEDDHPWFRTPVKSGSVSSMDSKHLGPHLIPSGPYFHDKVRHASLDNSSFSLSNIDDIKKGHPRNPFLGTLITYLTVF